MLILNNQEIAALLPFNEIIGAVEAAMIACERQTAQAPQRMHLDHGRNTFLCMPSLNPDFIGTKLVSVAPGNAAQGLPVTNGLMLLNDAATGLPLALMNAGKLTALRTGAVGAVGIKYMTPEDTGSVGLIGCGIQGMHQLVFACQVRPLTTVYCLRRTRETFEETEQFVRRHCPGVNVEPCQTADELLAKTNVIIAATISSTPVLKNEPARLAGKHFISVGSYRPNMQELPDAVTQLAGHLALDAESARHETGDTINPVKNGCLTPAQIFPIGKLLTGERQIDRHGTTAYKTAGMALFDLFVAQLIFRAAREKGVGTEVVI